MAEASEEVEKPDEGESAGNVVYNMDAEAAEATGDGYF